MQNKGDKSLLGIRFYYYAKLERHFAIVLYTNIAVSSRERKPRILSLGLEWALPDALPDISLRRSLKPRDKFDARLRAGDKKDLKREANVNS